MKIGIITFHRSDNYGSVLQAYALQNYLCEHGFDVEIIDYCPKAYKELYGLFLKNSSLRNIAKNLMVYLPILRFFKKRQNDFNLFRQNYLYISPNQYSYDSDLEKFNTLYDVLISGSDQVWNASIVDCDDAFFLPIEKVATKIAYAVSLNKVNLEEEAQKREGLLHWISDFDAISCREESGASLIADLTKKNARCCADPTFLLSQDDYDRIIEARIINEDYIFLFSVTYSRDVIEMAQKVSELTGLKIYSVMTQRNSYNYFLNQKKGYIHFIKNKQSPNDFLNYIKYATYVVTDSFHGTAFSIIFNKDFYTINRRKKDGEYYNDERLMNILCKVGLMNRFVCLDNFVSMDERIDFSKVKSNINSYTADSKEFLINGISNRGAKRD